MAEITQEPYRLLVGVSDPVDVERLLEDTGYAFEPVDDECLVVTDDTLPRGRCEVSWQHGAGFTDVQGRDLTAGDVAALEAVTQKVGFETSLTSNWAADVRAVARLAVALLPDCAGVYDYGSFVFLSPRWLSAVAESRPMRLSDLFEIHGVFDRERIWAHTHGLRRLGLPELEITGAAEALSLAYAGKVINATAKAMLVGGVPAQEEPLRIGTATAVEWDPWEAVEWGEGELGGADDRDEYHSGPSCVLYPSEAMPSLLPGLAFDGEEDAWAVESHAADAFVALARTTAADAWGAVQARDGRTMWISAGDNAGYVESYDSGTFVVRRHDEDDEGISVSIGDVDSWWATAGDYSLGPWLAYNVPVIEDVAANQRPSRTNTGDPVCSVCGRPLGGDHSC